MKIHASRASTHGAVAILFAHTSFGSCGFLLSRAVCAAFRIFLGSLVSTQQVRKMEYGKTASRDFVGSAPVRPGC